MSLYLEQKYFSYMKHTNTKNKNINGFIKINFSLSKYIITRLERKAIEWKKYFQCMYLKKELYQNLEFLQYDSKKTNNPKNSSRT